MCSCLGYPKAKKVVVADLAFSFSAKKKNLHLHVDSFSVKFSKFFSNLNLSDLSYKKIDINYFHIFYNTKDLSKSCSVCQGMFRKTLT